MVIPGTSHDLGRESFGSDAVRNNLLLSLPGSHESLILESSMAIESTVLRLGEVEIMP